MTGVDDLVAWLRVQLDARARQLDEDERVALAAHVGPWRAARSERSVYADESSVVSMPGPLPRWATYVVPPDSEGSEGIDPADAAHIARFDPHRMLAEVEHGRRDIEAVRRIIYAEQVRVIEEGGLPERMKELVETDVLYLLAQRYADQPGYREEWRP